MSWGPLLDDLVAEWAELDGWLDGADLDVDDAFLGRNDDLLAFGVNATVGHGDGFDKGDPGHYFNSSSARSRCAARSWGNSANM